MAKVLVTRSKIDIDQFHSLPSEEIITWFDSNCIKPDNSTLKGNHWKKQKPLRIEKDDNIELLQEGDEYIIVEINSIIRIENISIESFVYLGSKEIISTSVPVSVFAEVFKDYQFFLIHPNHLINVNHLKSYVKCNAYVTMSNTDAIPVFQDNDKLIIEYLNKKKII